MVKKNLKEKSSNFFNSLIDSRRFDETPKKKRRRLGKEEFCKKIFPHFFEFCKDTNSFDYIYKFTARMQDPSRNILPLFVDFYLEHMKELEEGLKKYAIKNIDCVIFYEHFSIFEDEIPEFLFNTIREFLD